MDIKLFISYSHQDESYKKELEKHLSLMKRNGDLKTWSDRKINPGNKWSDEIDRNLEEADIITLLISPDFIASDYCINIEVKRAIEKHENGEAIVLPILVRVCDWRSSPFGKLQALPREAEPIKKWSDQDEAWLDVINGIRTAIGDLEAKRPIQLTQVKPLGLDLQPIFKEWLEDTEVQLSHRNVNHVLLRAPLKIPKRSKLIQPGGQFHSIFEVFLSNN